MLANKQNKNIQELFENVNSLVKQPEALQNKIQLPVLPNIINPLMPQINL